MFCKNAIFRPKRKTSCKRVFACGNSYKAYSAAVYPLSPVYKKQIDIPEILGSSDSRWLISSSQSDLSVTAIVSRASHNIINLSKSVTNASYFCHFFNTSEENLTRCWVVSANFFGEIATLRQITCSRCLRRTSRSSMIRSE